VPLNLLFQRQRPEEIGLHPDGDPGPAPGPASSAAPGATPKAAADVAPNAAADVAPAASSNSASQTGTGPASDSQPADPPPPPLPPNVVDPAWVAVEWTLARAIRTARFWWVWAGFTCGMFAWYAVMVHQTQFLIDVGFTRGQAAYALGLVPLLGIAGQIGFGHLSDRIGREWGWTIGCAGFVLCYALLLALGSHPNGVLMFLMVAAQGLLGYSLTPNYGAIPAELFQGRHYGTIFGTLSTAAAVGASSGPWVAGLMYDRFGSYAEAFFLALALRALSCLCMWMAAPRKVRAVAGRIPARRSAAG
ncbi:MAG: MFS transporter, partial [Burkholderiales bacterium]